MSITVKNLFPKIPSEKIQLAEERGLYTLTIEERLKVEALRHDETLKVNIEDSNDFEYIQRFINKLHTNWWGLSGKASDLVDVLLDNEPIIHEIDEEFDDEGYVIVEACSYEEFAYESIQEYIYQPLSEIIEIIDELKESIANNFRSEFDDYHQHMEYNEIECSSDDFDYWQDCNQLEYFEKEGIQNSIETILLEYIESIGKKSYSLVYNEKDKQLFASVSVEYYVPIVSHEAAVPKRGIHKNQTRCVVNNEIWMAEPPTVSASHLIVIDTIVIDEFGIINEYIKGVSYL